MYQVYVNRLVAWYVGSMAVCVKMQEELEETSDDDMTEKGVLEAQNTCTAAPNNGSKEKESKKQTKVSLCYC